MESLPFKSGCYLLLATTVAEVRTFFAVATLLFLMPAVFWLRRLYKTGGSGPAEWAGLLTYCLMVVFGFAWAAEVVQAFAHG